jgi:hypothetical protein
MAANMFLSALVPKMLSLVPIASKLGDDELSFASGIMTLNQLERLCHEHPTNYIVEGLLPADDVHVAVGDSGLGKTPWAYQLGLCIASGKPFLGHAVKPSRVLYYDLENGREEILQVSRALCEHLGIEAFPENFLVIPNDGSPPSVEDAVAKCKPGLTIVDTLRALHPEAESDNSRMGHQLREFRRIARERHSAFLLLHHTKKPGELGTPALEDTSTLEWLLQAAGARALINQTNTRIALDSPRRMAPDEATPSVALVMKSFVKMKGESGELYLERVCDEGGEPIGYRRIVGVRLLGNPDQEAALGKLPDRFAFKEAKGAYNRSDDPTRKWLIKCATVGLVKQTGRGQYEKVPEVL